MPFTRIRTRDLGCSSLISYEQGQPDIWHCRQDFPPDFFVFFASFMPTGQIGCYCCHSMFHFMPSGRRRRMADSRHVVWRCEAVTYHAISDYVLERLVFHEDPDIPARGTHIKMKSLNPPPPHPGTKHKRKHKTATVIPKLKRSQQVKTAKEEHGEIFRLQQQPPDQPSWKGIGLDSRGSQFKAGIWQCFSTVCFIAFSPKVYVTGVS